MTQLGQVTNPDISRVIQDHEERIRALEAKVELIANDSYVWPSPTNTDNPVVAFEGQGVCVGLIADTGESADPLHVYLYDQATVPDGTGEPVLCAPGPAELGSVDGIPFEFTDGLAFRVVGPGSDPSGAAVASDGSIVLTLLVAV